ncbi:MAG: c-type cytochrome [Candidatus Acidiferrum sp.]|jgi:mono/diheme cytochrome c family protein
MKLYQFVIAGVLLFTGAVATAGRQETPRRSEQESVYAELKKAPEKYRAKINPLAHDADAAAAGRVLFEEHCEECHGEEAMGGKKAPSLRAEEVQNAAPGAIFWILTNGVSAKKCPCGRNSRNRNAGNW